MGTIVRPKRFDLVSKTRTNLKRRATAKAKREAEKANPYWKMIRTFWRDIEPQKMWDAGNPANDNTPKN